MLPRRRLVAAFAALTTFATTSIAADWPQWLGPQRDGVWREDGILDKLPQGGPKVLWRKPIDAGYTGPSVAGGRIYVMDRVKKEIPKDAPKGTIPGTERTLCLDLKTGETIWKHEYDRTYQRVDRPMGPRTTPTVDGDRVYTLGSMGDLYCLNAKDGKPIWHRYFTDEYKTKPPVWGHSAHVLVDAKNVYSLVGGEGSAVVAFDKMTGKELWRSLTSADVGYSPPIMVDAGGTKQLIVWLSDAIAGLNPENGSVYWRHRHPEQGVKQMTPAVTIIQPKVVGDLVVISSAYDGALAVKLDKTKPDATIAWRAKDSYPKSPEILPVLMTNLIARDGYLFSLFADQAELGCIEAATGKPMWKKFGLFGDKAALFGTVFWVEHGDRLFTFTDQGDLVILKLNKDGFEEISRAHVLDPIGSDRGRKVIWSHPAFADRKMIVRNEKEIVCFSLAKE